MKSPEPESLPPLKVLVEQARSPNAGRAEVDALLLGLAQPLQPGEEARERAELLHRILDDKRLRSFTGSNGRRVHAAAAQALVAMGQPYEQELSPEHLAAMRAAEVSASRSPTRRPVSHGEAHEPPPEGRSRRQWVGGAILVAVAAAELYVILVLIAPHRGLSPGSLLFTLCTTVVPAWLATSQKGVSNRVRHFISLGLVALPCPPMALGAFAFFMLRSTRPTMIDYVWLFGPWALVLARLMAIGCLYTKPRE